VADVYNHTIYIVERKVALDQGSNFLLATQSLRTTQSGILKLYFQLDITIFPNREVVIARFRSVVTLIQTLAGNP
jgi:hypothetical protein